jgi:hypothetical protein
MGVADVVTVVVIEFSARGADQFEKCQLVFLLQGGQQRTVTIEAIRPVLNHN